MRQKEFKSLLGPVATTFNNSPVGSWKTSKPIVITERCVLCKQCMQYCPTNVIAISSKSDEKIEIDYDYCKGCGICSNVCIKKCIEMVSNE